MRNFPQFFIQSLTLGLQDVGLADAASLGISVAVPSSAAKAAGKRQIVGIRYRRLQQAWVKCTTVEQNEEWSLDCCANQCNGCSQRPALKAGVVAATPATVAELVVAMIQLALTDNSFKADLRDQLELHGADTVRLVDVPDPEAEDILVLDPEHLRMLAAPIPHPERIVLVAGNRAEDMDHAWRAGLRSVVLRDDPIGTAVLAVLCTRLNLPGVENGKLEQKV